MQQGAPAHRIYPYLLRGVKSAYANQVGGIDITYIHCKGRWMYLVAILDWYNRYMVAWELDQTLEIAFVLACLEAALGRATPAICTSDQGSHFTSEQFVQRLLDKQVALGRYIADFYCAEARLLMEVDGSSHNATVEWDAARDEWLSLHGHHTLRVTNNDVRDNLEGVLILIAQTCTRLIEETSAEETSA
jgi:very-short-patch-repair endonuclease